MELNKIEAETTSHPWGPKEKSSNPRSPKLPYFDEHTDKMDSYLTRFESYAMSNKWDPSMSHRTTGCLDDRLLTMMTDTGFYFP